MPRSVALYFLILAIAAADWVTAAGVVVGILFCVPILLSSIGDRPGQVVTVTALSVVAFIVAAIFGAGPVSPQAIWLPNRVFALISILLSGPLALLLQRRRMAAESARELNGLLHSLMAHDMRSPLALARDALTALDETTRSGGTLDTGLLADVDARLRRSLRTIDLVLHAAPTDIRRGYDPSSTSVPVTHALAELRNELASFDDEARHRGKTLVLDAPGILPKGQVDAAVLRQAVVILVDNAVRYAVPGSIRIHASVHDRHLHVIVSDQGPGYSATAKGREQGAGLGIRLCALLVRRAGGSLEIVADGPTGTEFLLRLPTGP